MKNRIKELIGERGLKQKYVAERADMEPSWLSKIIHGRVKASERDWSALAEVLGVEVKELLCPECKEAIYKQGGANDEP